MRQLLKKTREVTAYVFHRKGFFTKKLVVGTVTLMMMLFLDIKCHIWDGMGMILLVLLTLYVVAKSRSILVSNSNLSPFSVKRNLINSEDIPRSPVWVSLIERPVRNFMTTLVTLFPKTDLTSQVNDHYRAVKKMIQLMSANNTDIINTVSLTPCIPHEKYEILNNYDKAYTFAPVYKAMLPNVDLYPHSQETVKNIRWWPYIKNDGQWLYTRHALASLNDKGMCYSLIPLNLLLRLGEAEETRKAILEENLLDAVIELPRELFSGGRPSPISSGGYTRYAIVVLKKGRTNKDVFMLNLASKASKGFLTSETKYEYCDFNDIDEVANIFKNRSSIDGISSTVSVETIFESGLCFNPSAFIRDEVLVNTRNYKELLSEQKQLEQELKEIDLAYKIAINKFEECL